MLSLSRTPGLIPPETIEHFDDEAAEKARRIEMYAAQVESHICVDPRWKSGNKPRPVRSDRGERYPSITAAAAAMRALGYSVNKSDIKAGINRWNSKVRIAQRYWYPAKLDQISFGTINRLTVFEEAPRRGYHIMVRCRCACGSVGVFYWQKVRRGLTKSCGCLAHDRTKFVTIDGVTKSSGQWCKHFGITRRAVIDRMTRMGLSIEEALQRPKQWSRAA